MSSRVLKECVVGCKATNGGFLVAKNRDRTYGASVAVIHHVDDNKEFIIMIDKDTMYMEGLNVKTGVGILNVAVENSLDYGKNPSSEGKRIFKALLDSKSPEEAVKMLTRSGNEVYGNTLVFNNDNTRGAELGWNLASGANRDNATDNTWHTADASRVTANQVNFLDSTNNDLYITGVQLEAGSEATDFERMSFTEELAICKRYFQKSGDYNQYMTNGASTSAFGTGSKAWAPCVEWGGTVAGHATHILSVEMRATPSITKYGNSESNWGYIASGGSAPTSDNTLAFHQHLYIGADGTGLLGVNNQATGSAIWGAMGGWTASAEI